MPLLDILHTLKDPAWLTFGLTVGIGLLGLGALVLLYPLSKD